MTRKRSTTAPRAWHACQECGRRLPNHPRTWKRGTCAGCVKRAQGKPRITEYDRLQGWLKASNHRA